MRKNQILETYMNEIYLGQNYAQGCMALVWRRISISVCHSMSWSRIKWRCWSLWFAVPSYYDPWRYPERAQQRRDMILRLMLENNQLTPEQFQLYAARPLGLLERGQMTFGRTPAFMNLLRRELRQRFGDGFLKQSGLKIFTSPRSGGAASGGRSVSTQLDSIENG